MAKKANEPKSVEDEDGAKFDKGFAESKTSRLITIAGIAALIGALVIYILRLDGVVGLTIDDAWYVLLAKALATGQGYTLINSPTPGILPLYPPGFPFLLSIFYRISPNFPENIWLLKSVSISAMMFTGVLTYRYLIRTRALPARLALLIAVATALCPPLVFLATSTVMSECVFAFVLIAVIVVAERGAQANREGNGKAMLYVIASAAMASYAFLTRSIAVALIGAVFLYFLKERLVRAALIFGLAVALFAGPWVIYSRLSAPTPSQTNEQGGHIIQPYTQQFWQRVASVTTSDTITAAEIPARVWNNILEITGKDVLRLVAAPLYEAMRDPYKEAQRVLAKQLTDKTEDTLILSFVLSIFIIVGFIAAARERVTCAEIAVPMLLGITTLWPWETIRFVLPLAPFLIFYFVMGFRVSWRLIRPASSEKASWSAPAVAAALVIAISLYGHLNYIAKKSDYALDRPQWLQTFDEFETMMNWVNQNVAKDETVVTLNPPLVNLYTGHKTVAWEKPAEKWELWKQLGVRRLVWFSAFYVPAEAEQRNYNPVYRARNQLGFQVLDLGPAESRVPWGAAATRNTTGN
ncbi:MAG: ArnT family glycosyltransferase [Blastocatellia bacterium]